MKEKKVRCPICKVPDGLNDYSGMPDIIYTDATWYMANCICNGFPFTVESYIKNYDVIKEWMSITTTEKIEFTKDDLEKMTNPPTEDQYVRKIHLPWGIEEGNIDDEGCKGWIGSFQHGDVVSLRRKKYSYKLLA